VDGIKLMVVFHDGSWKMKVGDTLSRPYKSEREAIGAAIKRARRLGRDGYESEVVMKMLTCRFGPNGLIETVPTRSRKTTSYEKPLDQ